VEYIQVIIANSEVSQTFMSFQFRSLKRNMLKRETFDIPIQYNTMKNLHSKTDKHTVSLI